MNKIEIEGSNPLFTAVFCSPTYDLITPLEHLIYALGEFINKRILPNILITWDFNLPDKTWEDEEMNITAHQVYSGEMSEKAIDIITENYFLQHVKEPTRNEYILLDLGMWTAPNLV